MLNKDRRRFKRALLTGEHLCPWWLAYTFDNRLRRWIHRPERLLDAYVRPGMTVVDIGCGMGHFSLGMARMVGRRGEVVAVDLQPQMLEVLSRRAEKQGLADRIRLHRCRADALGLEMAADFALTFWMAHEVGDLQPFMREIHALLTAGGSYFLAEPRLHVTADRFRRIAETAKRAGFTECSRPAVRLSRAVVFRKAGARAAGQTGGRARRAAAVERQPGRGHPASGAPRSDMLWPNPDLPEEQRP